MLEKLAQIEKNYEEINEQLSAPDVTSDIQAYTKLMKQHRSLGEVVEKYREVKKMREDLDGAREILDLTDDEEMRQMAELEIAELEASVEKA
jgi:peptide chain release factor 1